MDLGHMGRRNWPKLIVTVGEAMLRLSAHPGERLRNADMLDCYVAGSEANVAAALAYLSVPVRWVSAVPPTPIGDRVLSELEAAGVDIRYVERAPGTRLGLFFAEQSEPPRGSRVWYDRHDSAFAQMTKLPSGALAGAECVVVSGITPALGEGPRRLVKQLLLQCRETGTRLCVDVNYRALLWTPETAQPVLAELVTAAQVVLCSERDAQSVFQVPGTGAQAARAFAESWAPEAELVVITRGAQGAIVVSEGETFEQPPFASRVLDRFGAGDAFLAGVLWALWHDQDTIEAARAGAMLSALKCTTFGDIARFSSDDLRGALAGVAEGAIRR